MKVLVAIKRVIDSTFKVEVKQDETGIDFTNAKMCMNPFDEIAVEEACRLREKGVVNEIIAVSCGSISAKETLQTALSMGADRAILVETDNLLDPLLVAKLLKAIYQIEKPNLILLGKQATDDDANQVGQMLAGLLNVGQAISASKIVLDEQDSSKLIVDCEIDTGIEKIALFLPAVVTVDLRLNEPRYVTLPNIIKAKKKPLKLTTPEELGVLVCSDLKILKVKNLPLRSDCIILKDVDSLVDKLKNEVFGEMF